MFKYILLVASIAFIFGGVTAKQSEFGQAFHRRVATY